MSHEPLIRLTVFFGVFVLMAAWEWLAPRRILRASKALRWRSNLLLTALNSIVVRILFPLAGTGMAIYAEKIGWGLFNYFELSPVITIAVSVILLDMLIYWQHVAFHYVPVLWRLHRVHHADLDIDVTTGARFHTLEIVASMLLKFAAILLLGAPAIAVLIFEVLLNATAMFNHSNVWLPSGLDRIIRLLIVTPDMHRVHHSVILAETNSNYGFNLAIWDRLFGSYRNQPQAGHADMEIGLPEWRDPRICVRLTGMLRMPFRKN